MLYRLTYLRLGRPAGMTFWAADLVDATRFSEMWERVVRVQVLTLQPEGRSRFSERSTYTRKYQAVPAEALSHEEQFQLAITEA